MRTALAMPVREALELFDNKEIRKKLQALSDVGLDYLTLGQPLSTLSGASASASSWPANCTSRAAST